MTDLDLIQQTEQSLAAIRNFASQSNNAQLLEHIQRLEAVLRAGDAISMGNVSGSTAVAIGHDINIIINQVLPSEVKQPLENVQKKWSAAHLEVRKITEHSQGGHIFLSYTRADMDIALQIRRELEAAGHIVWQDLTAIKGGDEWIKSIERGVERCYALVTVVSETSQKSEWVQIEFLHAKRRGKTIIPIKVDASEIPTIMLAMNVVHGHPDLGAGIAQLLASLPAPAEIQPEPSNRRALELRYLDGLLLEHSVWQEVYTPMAGVGQLRAPKERKATGVKMKTAPTTIDVGYLGRKFTRDYESDLRGEAVQKNYEADITPAIEDMRQLIILGEPGAGKTTTLWKILSDHALNARDDSKAPLPMLVRLGALGSEGLEHAIKTQLGALGVFYEDLLREKRLVFLLDGLNEMTVAHREANLQAIKKLNDLCRDANLLLAVTCRELDYTGALDLNLPGRVTIQPLDPIRIRGFVNSYIEEPGKGDELFLQLADMQDVWKKWEGAGASFELFWTSDDIPKENPNVYSRTTGDDDTRWKALVHEHNVPVRSMMALAANPYMLFMITQVFIQAGVLPPDRGLLFQTFIDYLLEKRECLAPEQAKDLKTRLADLAYAMQAQGEGTAFMSEQVMKHLKDEQVLYHARSASLLAGGDQIRFTHQLLQEYFAAHRLQAMMTNTKAEALFPKDKWWEPQGWEETSILLAGLYSDDCTPVVEWLIHAQPEVVVRCILESGAHCPNETLARLREQWLPRLTDLKNDPSPLARAAIGRALGRLQLNGEPLDNRKGVSMISANGTKLPNLDWVEIPAGKFIYRYWQEKREEGLFFIARYPITFAQFQVFLDDPQGFANPRWWDGLSAVEDDKSKPGEQNFKFYNHPRENVSWYDAVAFCRWLTEKAKERSQLLPEKLAGVKNCIITLPTEWQWEKAARGTDGREYPYQGKFDAEKANTDETGIGQTSAVGIFPQGASPYGVMDMSGNVWEWCLDEYSNPEKIDLNGSALRLWRGGAWYHGPDHARASIRDYGLPYYRSDSCGFRVIVRPPSQ